MPAITNSRSDIDVPTNVPIMQLISKPFEVWSPVVTGLQTWVQNFSQANASMQREWLGFVERRLEEDAALPKRFTTCKAPDDAWRIYMDFLQTAADDYRKEAVELAKLSSSVANESLNGLKAPPSQNAPPPGANRR